MLKKIAPYIVQNSKTNILKNSINLKNTITVYKPINTEAYNIESVRSLFCPFLNNIDAKYKEILIESAGLTGVTVNALASVIGPCAFKDLVQEHNADPDFYLPGKRPKEKEAECDSYPLTNVENKKFGANLHIHTKHSDGQLSVQELLDKAAAYGDKYVIVNKKPFTIAITDHNTAEGCKEALLILAKNPSKYKNINVVLGAEISAKEDEIYDYKFRKPEKFHVLTMCINPFDEKFNSFINNINKGKKNTMNPRTIRLQEIVDTIETQPNAYLCYAHPAWPDMTHRISNANDDYCELNKKCIQYFTETVGSKGLYIEKYYGSYNGNLATDKKLHEAINQAIDESKLNKAGGLDTHGNNIFYNGQKIHK